MIESFAAFLSSLKDTSPIIFSGLAIGTGVVLFGSGDFVDSIGLREFKEANLPYLGGAFIISISILGAQLAFSLVQVGKKLVLRIQKGKKQKRRLEARISELTRLTPDEKSYLTPYIFNQQASVNFLIEDGVKGILETKGILFQASSVGNMLSGWAYNLQPWAREHLEANPDLLEGASDAVEHRFPSLY